jgi:hypothetical protein
MNKTFKKSNLKSPAYILCDILSAFLLFAAFVFIKEGLYIVGAVVFNVVPLVIWKYKLENKHSAKYFKWYGSFSIISIISLLLIHYYSNLYWLKISIFICFLLSTLIYRDFIFNYYPKKAENRDKAIARLKMKSKI